MHILQIHHSLSIVWKLNVCFLYIYEGRTLKQACFLVYFPKCVLGLGTFSFTSMDIFCRYKKHKTHICLSM